jgi:glycogenin glucosyltransferase
MVEWITVPASKTIYSLSEVDETKRIADALCATVEAEFARWRNLSAETVCYVTLASPSYDWGLRVMLRTLRRVSKAPVIVLSAQRWTLECDEPDVLALEVPKLVNPRYKPERPEYGETLTKLWAFALTCFRRVTYVDADCLFLQSIDNLFDMTGIVAGPNYSLSADQKGFNSGLFSFEPQRSLRDFIFERAHHTPSPEGADQGLLNELLAPQVRLLPPEYNVLSPYHRYAGKELKRSDIRIIHYIGEKPWQLRDRQAANGLGSAELEDLWTQQLTRDELLDLIGWWRLNPYPRRGDEELKARRARRRRKRIMTWLAAVLIGLLLLWLGYFAAGILRG